MLSWLFNKRRAVDLTNFSKLAIGQKFQKVQDGKSYIKKESNSYETVYDGNCCIRWYIANKDFNVMVED